MNRQRKRQQRRQPPGRLLAGAVLAAVAISWGATAATSGPTSRAAGPAEGVSDEAPELGTTPSPAASVRPVTPARRAGGPVAEDPVMMRLPSGAVVRVVAVSTRADGILDVPDDVRVAGWWRGGARVGDPFGSTLVAAHVDSGTQGLGPYAELLTARPGARIVLGSAHLTQPFRVTSLRLVARGTLADDAWMYAVSGRRRLTLVTCAGPYDRARGGYQNLAVVTALPAGPPARIP